MRLGPLEARGLDAGPALITKLRNIKEARRAAGFSEQELCDLESRKN